MIVTANLIATFKFLAGTREVVLNLLDNSTLQDVVNGVLQEKPKLRSHWLNDKGELRAHVHVFINGDDANTLPLKMETIVKNGDEVDFIPPVAGG